jgi:hypothetical protein
MNKLIRPHARGPNFTKTTTATIDATNPANNLLTATNSGPPNHATTTCSSP